MRRLDREVRLPAEVIEEALLEENPGLADEMLTVTCRAAHVQEVRMLPYPAASSRAPAPPTWHATATLSEAIFSADALRRRPSGAAFSTIGRGWRGCAPTGCG